MLTDNEIRRAIDDTLEFNAFAETLGEIIFTSDPPYDRRSVWRVGLRKDEPYASDSGSFRKEQKEKDKNQLV